MEFIYCALHLIANTTQLNARSFYTIIKEFFRIPKIFSAYRYRIAQRNAEKFPDLILNLFTYKDFNPLESYRRIQVKSSFFNPDKKKFP